MKYIAIIMLLGLSIISPARGIMCTVCNDCKNHNTSPRNQTCLTGQDTCMKIDFGQYAYKQCGTQSTMCTPTGFNTTNSNLMSTIRGQVGVTADAILAVNKNSEGNTVLNCCMDRDYCNNGMHKTLSLLAILGMILTYIIA